MSETTHLRRIARAFLGLAGGAQPLIANHCPGAVCRADQHSRRGCHSRVAGAAVPLWQTA